MILTEQEAKSKWCPMARVAVQVSPDCAFNRHGWDANCSASECMAWRWHDLAEKWVTDIEGHYKDGIYHDPRGFCGLAGRPE